MAMLRSNGILAALGNSVKPWPAAAPGIGVVVAPTMRMMSRRRKPRLDSTHKMLPTYHRARPPTRFARGEPHPGHVWFTPIDTLPSAVTPESHLPPNSFRRIVGSVDDHPTGNVKWTTKKQSEKDEAEPIMVAAAAASAAGTFDPMVHVNTRNYVLNLRRVCNVTPRGKTFRISSLAVAGTVSGFVGLGMGKHANFTESGNAAIMRAVKSMVPVARYDQRTVMHNVEAVFHRTKLSLFPRPPGFGLKGNPTTTEILRCAGYRDVTARVDGSRNKMNVAFATIKALLNQNTLEGVARARGLRLHDVWKLAYG